MTTPQRQQCVECGARLPAYWPRGLCVRCALQGALKLSHAESQVLEQQQPGGIAADPNPGASAAETAAPASFGDYEVLEEIARGGMGVVYRARQVSLDRIVAVKMILAGALAGKEFVRRFRTEASAAAILQHPNIVAIHEVGVDQGRHYYSMDYIQGQNLAQLVRQQPLPAASAARYVERIAETIHYAHERGVLHRDLKPSNVLVDAATDEPRVTDFGLAKRFDGESSLTVSGQMLGSPNFIPPEQAGVKRGTIDRRSDVYALGGILYYLLTGRPPFHAESLEGIVTQVLNAEPVSPRRLNPSIPRDLETITLKCIEKAPSRRYQTAQELADELGRVLRHEPIRARPVSAPEELWRWCRRKPGLAGAFGFALAALLTGLASTSWQWRRAENQREVAQHLLYVANMNLVQQAWEENNVRRVQALLQETALAPERGFEWCYWQQQLRLASKTLRGHLQGVTSVAFSPNGTQILSGSFDRSVRLWDAASGRERLQLTGHTSWVRSVAFSSDEQRVVSGSDDGTAKTWDATTGRELLTLHGHASPVWSVAFSPDGQRIVTSSQDQTLKLWNAENGQELFTLNGHTNWVRSVAYSPDGRQILSGSDDHTARVWDAASGRTLLRLAGHTAPIWSVAFSSDGRRIVTGSEDRTAKVWDGASGQALLTLKGHTGWVRSAAFRPDGGQLVTVSSDQTCRIWDATSGEELRILIGHSDSILSVSFSPDGQRIATGGWDQTIKVWEAASSHERVALKGHRARIRAIAFSADGQRMVTGSEDRSARVWDLAGGRELLALKAHTGFIRALAFSADGRRIVTGSDDHTAIVWDASNGRELITFRGHDDWVMAAAFSPDGQRVVTGSKEKTRLWDVASGRELLTLQGDGDGVLAVAFSPDGRLILSGSGEKTANLWDATNGRLLLAVKGHQSDVSAVTFSANGRHLVTGSADQTVKFWDATSGKEIMTFRGHGGGVNKVAVFPDGQRMVSASDDQTVKVWDTTTGRELLTLKGNSRVLATAISKDGHRIFTASEDQTARVWQAAQPAQILAWQEEERRSAQHLAAVRREMEQARARVGVAGSTATPTNRIPEVLDPGAALPNGQSDPRTVTPRNP